MTRNADVDAWMSRYQNPMKDVVQRVREHVLAADPRMDECIKWQAPTFTYKGNLASFFPRSKAHASLMFHQGAEIPGKHPRLEGGGDTGRMMKIASVEEADRARADITRVVKAWCDWKDGEDGGKTKAGKPAKQAAPRKSPAKKSPAKKTPAEKPAARKTAPKRTASKKSAAKKTASKKAR